MNTHFALVSTFASRFALAGALLVALVAGPASVHAASEIDEPVVDTTELEAVFWACDFAASKYGVDRTEAVLCGTATDELKMKRFGGSFERMLEWWNASKAERYAALADALAARDEASESEMQFPESI